MGYGKGIFFIEKFAFPLPVGYIARQYPMLKRALIVLSIVILSCGQPHAVFSKDDEVSSNHLGPKSLFESQESKPSTKDPQPGVGALVRASSTVVIVGEGVSQFAQPERVGGVFAHEWSA